MTCCIVVKSSAGDSKYDYLGIFLFGSLSLGTGALGVWQLRRYNEKLSHQFEKNEKLSDDIVPFPMQVAIDQIREWALKSHGRRTVLEGEYLYSNEVLLGLRTAPNGLFNQAQGLSVNPQGYYVITPFKLSNGSVIYSN